jgi:glycosyltransferase involved in cell wall biosynthesis
MRKRFVQAHMDLVDLFIAPSRFLMERFVEWGIPRAKIVFEPYGRLPIGRPAPAADRPRTNFGFFGQLLLFKGVKVLLEAMDRLGPDFAGHLYIHGANLELQPQEFRDEFETLMKKTRNTVTFVGRYDQDGMPRLVENVDWMIVPSIWWENHPLVIQEAFLHRRPVICSDIGGMAEAVEDGVNGLHFHVGDANDLALTIERAATTAGLWDTLRSGIGDVYTMDDHLETLGDMYDRLTEQRRAMRTGHAAIEEALS